MGSVYFTMQQKTGLHAASQMHCSVHSEATLTAPVGRGATDIPFSLQLLKNKQGGGLHSSKQIHETAAQFFTLFSHSTRSTSGKWTCNREKKADNIVSLAVSVRFHV